MMLALRLLAIPILVACFLLAWTDPELRRLEWLFPLRKRWLRYMLMGASSFVLVAVMQPWGFFTFVAGATARLFRGY
jgi:hypothetical protein